MADAISFWLGFPPAFSPMLCVTASAYFSACSRHAVTCSLDAPRCLDGLLMRRRALRGYRSKPRCFLRCALAVSLWPLGWRAWLRTACLVFGPLYRFADDCWRVASAGPPRLAAGDESFAHLLARSAPPRPRDARCRRGGRQSLGWLSEGRAQLRPYRRLAFMSPRAWLTPAILERSISLGAMAGSPPVLKRFDRAKTCG